jgi:hypothetical protein
LEIYPRTCTIERREGQEMKNSFAGKFVVMVVDVIYIIYAKITR